MKILIGFGFLIEMSSTPVLYTCERMQASFNKYKSEFVYCVCISCRNKSTNNYLQEMSQSLL